MNSANLSNGMTRSVAISAAPICSSTPIRSSGYASSRATLKRLSSSTLGLSNANATELATPPAKQPSNLSYTSYTHTMSELTKRRLRNVSSNSSSMQSAACKTNNTAAAAAAATASSSSSSSSTAKRSQITKIASITAPPPSLSSSSSSAFNRFMTKNVRSRSDLAVSSSYGYQKTSAATAKSSSAARNSNLPTRIAATHRVHPQPLPPQVRVTATVQAVYDGGGNGSGSGSSQLRQPRSYQQRLPLHMLAMSSATRLLHGAAGSGGLRGGSHL